MILEARYRRLLVEASDHFPAYPEGRYRGRGIVICAGGPVHLANAFVCMKFLREFTGLPIELFYVGYREIPDKAQDLFKRYFPPIDLIDITKSEYRNAFPFLAVEDFRGFQIKPYALVHSSFEEIFYIDADNIPLQSPEPLFSAAPYHQAGALFWPDIKGMKSTTESLFRTFGIDSETVIRDSEFESGQILLDKRRCWKALMTVCFANSDVENFRAYCYANTLGDKDTFRLSFHFAKQPYHLMCHPSLRVGNLFFIRDIPWTNHTIKIQHPLGAFYATGILQHDFAGIPLFVHKTVREWDLYLDYSLMYVEDVTGSIRLLPLLEQMEERGLLYLNEFRSTHLKVFGRSYLKELQSLIAKGIMRTLDLIRYLKN